jgi:transcriptional antiterminator NusG
MWRPERVCYRAGVYLWEMGVEYYWYVLFVMSGCEESVVRDFEKQFKEYGFKAFIPMREIIFRRNGKNNKEKEPMFPGYVFVETAMPGKEFLEKTANFVQVSDGVMRVLKYGGTDNIAIHEEEMRVLQYLLGNKRCVETSTGFKEGDKIIITTGILKGHESIIKKINAHKREAYIETGFMGGMRLIGVGLEIIEKHR